MRSYSIYCGEAGGGTQASEVRPFKNNRSARIHARALVKQNAVVEVWREGNLIVRLYRNDRPTAMEKADSATRSRTAFLHADRDRVSGNINIAQHGLATPTDTIANSPPQPPAQQRPGVSRFPPYLAETWLPLQPTVPQQ